MFALSNCNLGDANIFSCHYFFLNFYHAFIFYELKFYCAYCLIGIDAPPRFPALTSTGIIGNYRGTESFYKKGNFLENEC
jgi:hypothetical protein